MAETLSAHALTLDALRDAYTRGTSTPAQVIDAIHARAARFADRNMWIRPVTEAELSPYLQRLADSPVASLPLWGVPFVIKDNIDLAGIPTTAGCPAFGYTPTASAFVVQQLIDAGAIPVAKANLDQFATGLNGTRSPHGPCRNAFDADFVSGGSSSGSAVSVALGLASFSLGTDTAGSGRVPACFNNLVGLKPTRGLLSASGSVPACRSLDCISVFALTAADANAVLACAEGQDTSDGYSRANRFDNSARQFGRRSGPLRVGVIPEPQLQFFGDEAYQAAYARSLARLQADGITVEEVDYAPFAEAAALLYEGPWVSERYIAMEGILRTDPEAVFPTVRSIVEPGAEPRATDLFRAQYRLAELQGVCAAQLARFDCLLTPTAGRLFTVAEMLEEPIKRNSELGYYTNFMNLLDMAAVSVPTAFTEAGLPFGITVAGPAFSDRALLSIAQRIQDLYALPVGTDPAAAAVATAPPAVGDRTRLDVVVCGAHMSGLPLNWQLTERGGTLKAASTTAPRYTLHALAGLPPARPGLVRNATDGAAIDVEVWTLPAEAFGGFVDGIPSPLGIGKVELDTGEWVNGFLCEPAGLDGARDITALGGWRVHLAQNRESTDPA